MKDILSQDEYLKIKEFIDIIESAFVPTHKYFDSYKKCYSHYYCSCYYCHKKKKIDIFFLAMNIENFVKKL